MTEAEKVATILQEAEVGDVVVSRRKDNQIPVVKCSNINLSVLKDKINPTTEKAAGQMHLKEHINTK